MRLHLEEKALLSNRALDNASSNGYFANTPNTYVNNK